jgi:uncharacterized protein YuzE
MTFLNEHDMKIKYDPISDVIYFEFRDTTVTTKRLTADIAVDTSAEAGKPVGVGRSVEARISSEGLAKNCASFTSSASGCSCCSRTTIEATEPFCGAIASTSGTATVDSCP